MTFKKLPCRQATVQWCESKTTKRDACCCKMVCDCVVLYKTGQVCLRVGIVKQRRPSINNVFLGGRWLQWNRTIGTICYGEQQPCSLQKEVCGDNVCISQHQFSFDCDSFSHNVVLISDVIRQSAPTKTIREQYGPRENFQSE